VGLDPVVLSGLICWMYWYSPVVIPACVWRSRDRQEEQLVDVGDALAGEAARGSDRAAVASKRASLMWRSGGARRT